MQDLSRYQKREHIVIHTRYVTPLVVGNIALLGLVFALGMLLGARRTQPATCPQQDLLAQLDTQSGEPQVPEEVTPSFHKALTQATPKVPIPASLKEVDAQGVHVRGESAPEPQLIDAVAVESPREEEPPVPEKVRDDEAEIFTLQVGTFQDQREASLLVQRLRRAGHKSFLVRVNMPERGGVWYRVRVGPFHSKKEAWAYKEQFEETEQLPAFVVKRRG